MSTRADRNWKTPKTSTPIAAAITRRANATLEPTIHRIMAAPRAGQDDAAQRRHDHDRNDTATASSGARLSSFPPRDGHRLGPEGGPDSVSGPGHPGPRRSSGKPDDLGDPMLTSACCD